MHAPIAEVPPPPPRHARKPPPLSLSIIVGFGLALGLLDSVLAIIAPTRPIPELSPFWGSTITLGLLTFFHFIPLLLVWRGANWARWLMIAISTLLAVSSLGPPNAEIQYSLIQRTVNQLYAPYYLALIIFLLTPAMRRHFGKLAHAEAP